MKMLRIAAAGWLSALALPVVALDVAPPQLVVQQHQLDNGLRLLLHQDHSVPVVNLQVWYHVGSKDERPGRSGFAHMFEHLMFKGSDNVAPEEHKSYIQGVGGRYNATTDQDRTLYWQTFPSNYLERILWMEADRLRSLHVSEENFVSERDVVKEERRLRVDNPPFGRIFETLLAAAYQVHPYRIDAIGTMADLNAATIEDVREFHRIYYVPNNATVVIAGDFDAREALAWVQKYFGPIPRGADIPRERVQEPPQTAERRVVRYDTNAPLPAVMLAYHIPAEAHPDIYPLRIASGILTSGESSRLHRKLVYETQMAAVAAGQALVLEDPGLLMFYSILNPGHTPEAGEAALVAEIDRLQNEPVSAEELQKMKNQVVSQLVFGRETVQQKANAIGHAAVILGDVELLKLELAQYQKVTVADVQRVARTYFSADNRTTIHMLPESMRPAPGGEQATEGR